MDTATRLVVTGCMNNKRNRATGRVCVFISVALFVLPCSTAYSSAPTLEVVIEGVPERILPKITSAVDIYREHGNDTLDEQQLRTLHRRAEDQINTALQSFGFYKSSVKGTLQRRDQQWIASYVVSVGPPLRYQDIQIKILGEGREEPDLQDLFDNFPIQVGYIVDHTVYEAAKQQWLRTAIDLGYLDARLIKREIRIDMQRYKAQLSLTLDTGPLFYFGIINLIQDDFDNAFLERYVDIKPGQRYSAARIIALEHALRDSGYFLEVLVRPKLEDAVDQRVPIDVILTSIKPSSYVFGMGYGTDTGVRARIGWEQHRVNRHGHQFVANLRVSPRIKDASTRYVIPIRNPRNDRFSIFAAYSNDDPDTSDSELGRLGISRATVHGRTRWEYLLTFQHETFTVSDQQDTVNFLTPGVNFSWVAADDRLFPARGLRADIGLILSYDGILSDVSFAQTRLQGKVIHPLGSRGRLILRGDAGFTIASEVTVLPASIRFFAGGDQSVRGYDYKELGPVDQNGEVIGGRYLLVGSMEYEHRVTDNWSVAAFLDSGNAFDDFDEPLEQGAGFGVRWRSPVGPVRLDIANAISKDGNPWRVHFTIGPDL
jgi:translocation and assembly module TamA